MENSAPIDRGRGVEKAGTKLSLLILSNSFYMALAGDAPLVAVGHSDDILRNTLHATPHSIDLKQFRHGAL